MQAVDCAFVVWHTTPHPPQFDTVLTCISQPFDINPSQLPQPVLHVIEQLPTMHDAVPLVLLQTVPHAPQFAAEVCVFVSQPLRALPSQLAKPALHTGWHALETHEVVPLGFVHACPQPPQWSTELERLVSHPFCKLLSQLP